MSGAASAVAIGVGAMAVGSLVGNMISPQMPSLPAAPVAPTAANSAGVMDSAAQAQADAALKGRTSTLLTGGQGLSNMGETTSKQLLGA